MAGEIKLNNVSIATENAGVVSFSNAVVGGVPAGAIMSFAMSSAPTGWVVCNGAVYAQGDYSALYASIGSTWVTAWTNSESITTGDYRKNSSGVIYIATSTGTTSGTDVGDDVGVTWSTSTNFLVPDLRGAFLRGIGTGTLNSRNKVGPTNVGDFQEDKLQDHRFPTWYPSNVAGTDNMIPWTNTYSVYDYVTASHFDSTGGAGSGRFGDETAPYNAGINYCIKY